MSINLTPEDINRVITDAVAKSLIGEEISKAVSKAVSDLAKSYQNPFEATIKVIISKEIERVVVTEFAPAIREKAAERVRQTLTDETLDAILVRIIEAARKAVTESRY